jgi:hypothetical protein
MGFLFDLEIESELLVLQSLVQLLRDQAREGAATVDAMLKDNPAKDDGIRTPLADSSDP